MTTHRHMPRRVFCLRLPGDLHVRLKVLAALRRVSTNTLACQALEMWADVLERREYYAAHPPEASSSDSDPRAARNRRSRRSGAGRKRLRR